MATTRVEPTVCFGSSQRSWVTDLINYVSDHGGMRVVGTVLTQEDAVGLGFDVLVIDDVSSILSPRLVHRLHGVGRLVVGVFDAERSVDARDRLLAAGIDAVVSSDATAAEFVRVIGEAVRQRSIDREFADLVVEIDEPAGPNDDEGRGTRIDSEPTTARGRIVVVTGADGVTEVAVGIAEAMVVRRVSIVVVDMDTLEPSIAQRLSMPLTPNIFTATEHLRLRSTLADGFAVHSEGFAVVAGIPNPREWENLSETEAADLIEELATGFQVVVVKINRHLEDLSSFAGTAGRFDVGRRVAGLADDVVAVTSASPLGGTRLLALAGDLRHVTPAPIHVVVNQAPSSQFVQGEIGDEISRSMAPASLTFLPIDAKVRKAAWQGNVVRAGGFMRRLGKLAERFVPAGERPATTAAPDAPAGNPAARAVVEDPS